MSVVSMALAAWMAIAQAGMPKQKLTVVVQGAATVRPIVLFEAQEMTTRMFARIGITLNWRTGAPRGESALPIVMSFATQTPEMLHPGALAYALPYEGVHVTVFADRVQNSLLPRTILAHVMVHEITHLVEGVDRHSDTGVMKARWTGKDYACMRTAPLAFDLEDILLIRAGLSKRGGAASAQVR